MPAWRTPRSAARVRSPTSAPRRRGGSPGPGNALPCGAVESRRETEDPPPVLGPDSLVWRLGGDWTVLLGGGRALLLQVSHPTVAAGVEQHSDFRSNPWKRLTGTLDLY